MSLLESVKKFIGALEVGDRLKWITGKNTLEVVSVTKDGEKIRFKRDAAGGKSSEHTVNISALDDVIQELASGKAVHLDTFLQSGGHLRTAYETLLAHSPYISWCKINNKKHLKAFNHEVHDPGELWRSDDDSWSNPEWALATLTYLNHVKVSSRSTIAAELVRAIVDTTERNESSWQRRITNFKAAEEDGSYDGGPKTKERALRWINRAGNDLNDVISLAEYSFSPNASAAQLETINKALGVKFKINQCFPDEMDDQTLNLKKCLYSKPFTILTGASGTGKTQLAIRLAKHLSNDDDNNSEIVAVGADWTDNRSVLGFVNHLNTDDDGPRYQSTPILDLLLRATRDPAVPYFLILDEMNLSHVERYFADFLSAMEQKKGVLKLHSENSDLKRTGKENADVPAELPYPENLFVIGTVNIDETTYMFSPKVLDRANVIEFTVSEGEIGAFLKKPHGYPEIERAKPGVAEGFLQLAKQARAMGCNKLPEKTAEYISKHLLDLFKILKAERFEFAYRTAKEVNTYLRVCRHLADDSDAWDAGTWNEDLDDQILQKLLPKLHGSMGRIGGLLAALASYCHKGAIEAETAQAQTKIQLDEALQFNEGDAVFPKSLKKIQAMIQTLRDEQFVSFIQ